MVGTTKQMQKNQIIIAYYYSETPVSSYVIKISYNDATSGFNYMVG